MREPVSLIGHRPLSGRERSFVYPSSTVGPFRPFADETDARQTPDECIRGIKIDLRPKIDLP